MKKLISLLLAVVCAYVIIKVTWWIFRLAFSIAIDIVQILLLVVVALPLYVLFSRRVFR